MIISVDEPGHEREAWMRSCALAFVVALLLLPGCASTTPEQRTNIAQLSVAEACEGYAGALNVLALQRTAGRLTDHDIQVIDALNHATDPICSSKAPPIDPADTALLVSTAATKAMAIFYQHQQKKKG